MNWKYLLSIIIGTIFMLTIGCKSEFEKVRISGDPEFILKKALNYFEEEEYQKAQTLFELAISSFRGKKEAEDLYYKYAYTYYHLERYILAAYYFKNFSTTFGASPLKEEADFMAAYCNYKMSPTFRLDQSYTDKAIDGLQLFVNTYPSSSRVEECNLLIDEMRKKQEIKAFAEGELYFNLRQYQSAMHSFENLLKDFPETTNSENVRYMIIRASYLLAANSVVDKQEERFKNTSEKAEEFLSRFPESSFVKDVNTVQNNSQKKLKEIDNVRHKNKSTRLRS